MYTCGFRINANLVGEGSFCINAKFKLVKKVVKELKVMYITKKSLFQYYYIIRMLVHTVMSFGSNVKRYNKLGSNFRVRVDG